MCTLRRLLRALQEDRRRAIELVKSPAAILGDHY